MSGAERQGQATSRRIRCGRGGHTPTQSADRLGVGRVIDGITFLEITGNAQPSQQRSPIRGRIPAHLPDAPAGPQAIATSECRQLQIRLLEQERGTRGSTASADERAFQQDGEIPADANACATKAPVIPPPTIATLVS